MKVLFVWDSEYPWDIRVEKICDTLHSNGWEVHLVCRNRMRRPVEELYNGINIHRLPFISGYFNDIYTFPAFISPVWLKRIHDVVTKYHIDLIIVRDIPLSLAAVIVGKISNVPIILDMAETYPEMIRLIWKYEPFKIRNIILRNPLIVDAIETIALNSVNHIFAMVEESKSRLVSKGIESKKISIVSNTPIISKYKNVSATYPGILKEKRNKLILLYVGFVNYSRGIDTVLDSLKEYVKINEEVYFAILGTGNAEKYLKEKITQYGLEKYVGFAGWVENSLVPEYVSSSDVCIVPHHKCGHWDHTIPNKLFDYMAAGKPVLVSNCNPMERIVESTKCGLVYKDYDIDDFVLKLQQLVRNENRNAYGNNGSQAIREYYNWRNDSEVMLQSIKEIFH